MPRVSLVMEDPYVGYVRLNGSRTAEDLVASLGGDREWDVVGGMLLVRGISHKELAKAQG